jgi:hypothetical protein
MTRALTACPGPGPPATVGGRVGTRLRRVLLRWQAPQPCPAHRATRLTRPVAASDPYVNGYVNPSVIPYARGVRTPGCAGRGYLSSTEALRGSGAAAPSGALRAIDATALSAFLADLRPAPPAAAILSLTWLPPRVVRRVPDRPAPQRPRRALGESRVDRPNPADRITLLG